MHPRTEGSVDVSRRIPLVVDLDQTLLKVDSLLEGLVMLGSTRPRLLSKALGVLLRKRNISALKDFVASNTTFNVESVPFNFAVVKYLHEQHALGREIHLVSGADASIVAAVSKHLGIFKSAQGSFGGTNNVGKQKLKTIMSQFPVFEYLGDSRSDYPVWEKAEIVSASARTRYHSREIKRKFPTANIVSEGRIGGSLLKQLRPHQWIKNLLVFVSIVASGRYTEGASWVSLAVAFVAFSGVASSVYLLNDISDHQNDRLHPDKAKRPIASGAISIRLAAVLFIMLLGGSMFVSGCIGYPFLAVVSIYVAVNLVYTFYLKRLVLIDVFALASLYTLRIWAGAVVIDESLSFWIFAFSLFLFLSLALMKRFTEIRELGDRSQSIPGRGYTAIDSAMVGAAGLGSSFAAMLILALYIDSQQVAKLYSNPAAIWLMVPAVSFWLLDLWIKAGRGQIHSDPVLYAVRDKTTYVVVAVCLLGLVLART